MSLEQPVEPFSPRQTLDHEMAYSYVDGLWKKMEKSDSSSYQQVQEFNSGRSSMVRRSLFVVSPRRMCIRIILIKAHRSSVVSSQKDT